MQYTDSNSKGYNIIVACYQMLHLASQLIRLVLVLMHVISLNKIHEENNVRV